MVIPARNSLTPVFALKQYINAKQSQRMSTAGIKSNREIQAFFWFFQADDANPAYSKNNCKEYRKDSPSSKLDSGVE